MLLVAYGSCNAIIVDNNNLLLCNKPNRKDHLTCNSHGYGHRLRCRICQTTYILTNGCKVNIYMCPACEPSLIVFEHNNFIISVDKLE